MKLRYHSVVIFTADIEAAKRFYCAVLGLEIDMDMGANVILKGGITLWQPRPGHILSGSIGARRKTDGGNGFELYLETDDLPATLRELKSGQVEFLHELREESWGQRTVRLFDPDRNIVEIGETLPTFLSRMQREGLTIEQIAARTGMIPQDILRSLNP